MIGRVCRGSAERPRVRALDRERGAVPCPECARYFVLEEQHRPGESVTLPEHEPLMF